MSAKNLAVYLQDHAAGAGAALDLLDHLIGSHEGTADEAFFAGLRSEIVEDKAVLDKLLARLDSAESTLRNLGSRLGKKAARSKFLLEGPGHGQLRRFEALEILSLGIEGKRGLWQALAEVAGGIDTLRETDFAALIGRAERQRGEKETRRLAVARVAFMAED